jgi:hypothetical protein
MVIISTLLTHRNETPRERSLRTAKDSRRKREKVREEIVKGRHGRLRMWQSLRVVSDSAGLRDCRASYTGSAMNR